MNSNRSLRVYHFFFSKYNRAIETLRLNLIIRVRSRVKRRSAIIMFEKRRFYLLFAEL